jgi:hypothetical protein
MLFHIPEGDFEVLKHFLNNTADGYVPTPQTNAAILFPFQAGF